MVWVTGLSDEVLVKGDFRGESGVFGSSTEMLDSLWCTSQYAIVTREKYADLPLGSYVVRSLVSWLGCVTDRSNDLQQSTRIEMLRFDARIYSFARSKIFIIATPLTLSAQSQLFTKLTTSFSSLSQPF